MDNKKVLTLCIVVDKQRILLGLKKRGFGQGKWNGFGGKVEAGEPIELAAKRELKEEAGIDAANLTRHGVLLFDLPGHPQHEVHVFSTQEFFGEPKETEEMKPQWFPLTDIPYQSMWADDEHWLPLLLNGKSFNGHFVFDKDNVIMKAHLIKDI